MKLNIITLALLILSFGSCKNDGKLNDPKSSSQQIKGDDVFRVKFNLTLKKDDNLCLYYTHDGSINFNDKETVWIPLKGNETAQDIVFELPESVIPSFIRIDFGSGKNLEQSDVALKVFEMSYNGKISKSNGAEILNYFVPFEPYTKVTPNTSVLQRLKKDQTAGPILYPKETQTAKINELTRGESPE